MSGKKLPVLPMRPVSAVGSIVATRLPFTSVKFPLHVTFGEYGRSI